MLPSKFPEQDLIPKMMDASQLQKGLGCCSEVLTREVSKRKNVGAQPVTGVKLVNTILTQIVTKYSAQGAREVLDCVEDVIISLCKGVLAQPDPSGTLEAIIETHEKKNAPPVLSMSPPTLSKYLDRFTTEEAKATLSEQVGRIRFLLGKQGLWPKEVHLSLDPTDEPYRGKYHNQFTNWGLVGQQSTYKRVFKGLGIYLNPTQLLVGYAPVPLKTKDPTKREMPGWILEMCRVVTDLHSMDTAVPLVTHDRGYYSALAMALAYTGGLVPDLSPHENPRLLCPKKFWEDVLAYKWRYILDPDAPAVEVDTMQLTYYDQRLLGNVVTTFPLNDKGDHRLVPVATVATFDAYTDKRAPKSLEWAHGQAARIDRGIQAALEAKREAEAEFSRYTRDELGVKRKMPAYRGKGRTKFKFSGERERYQACRRAHANLQRWKREKTKLCERLTFFTVSTREGEAVDGNEQVFLALAGQYRERWGIENGFKSVKSDFRVKTNSRKTTARHVRFILGAMLYNAWHYRRLSRVARHFKKIQPGWKPFDISSPPIRKKFEREVRPILTARGYILEELTTSLNLSIEAMLIQITAV